MPESSQHHASIKPIASKEKVPPPIPSSINTDDTHSSSTVMLPDGVDYFCDSMFQGDASPRPMSPLVTHTLERQRRDRQALVQKRRMKQSKNTKTSGHKHRVETIVPANQKRIRVADTLLFIKEGYIIGEENLAESVRVLHSDNERKEEEASVGDPANDPIDDLPKDPPHWYHNRRLWVGVAIATVAAAAVVLVRRKR